MTSKNSNIMSHIFVNLKEVTKKFWQYYMDIPIFGKITMMLLFCLMGYIVVGIFYAGGIWGINRQLNSFKATMERMFDISETITSHINIIKADISVLQKPGSSLLEQQTSVLNSIEHFNNLQTLIKKLEEHKPCWGELNYEFGEDTTWPLSDRNSVLVISVNNALSNIKKELDFLKKALKETKSKDSLSIEILNEHTENIEKSLAVLDELSTAIRQNIAIYTNCTIDRINNNVIWRLSAGLLITAFVMLMLVVASYTWGAFLVGPLKQMAEKLRSVQSTTMNADGCTAIANIPVTGQDEIGKVAMATNKLLQRMRNICHFRRTIESDETTTDVYHRLGVVFKRDLDLQSFVIYETRSHREKMLPVYVEPPELIEELEEMDLDCEKCRAWRTGSFITSFQDEGICPVFAWPKALTHACIPMAVGGEILGIVQFLFPFVNNREREEAFQRAVMEAKFYLSEAMPVIKAKLLAQTLTENATRDQLTGLFNRRYLEMNLDHIVARAKRSGTTLGILMCDLDYFKEVNDQHGHDTGDMVLVQLAKIIKKHARESDMVVRFGGEEFLVLLVDCEPGFAEKVAERIRTAVEECVFRFPTIEFSKTISVGISEFPGDAEQIWEVIKYADVALYNAKENGRNRIERFRPEMWKKSNF